MQECYLPVHTDLDEDYKALFDFFLLHSNHFSSTITGGRERECFLPEKRL